MRALTSAHKTSLAALLPLFLLACGGGGTSGAGGTGGGGTSGSADFKVVAPCAAEADYQTGSLVVDFPGTGFKYTPACLKISPNQTVTFTGAAPTGVFQIHPLEPSTMRGDLGANPIPTTQNTSLTLDVTFPARGFFAYFCRVHGMDSDGSGMSGVI